MIYMYRIAVVGNYESICGFASLGLDIYGVSNQNEAEETVKKLAESRFGIIFVTEGYLEKMPRIFEKYREAQIPAIIPIPDASGATGFGMGNVKKYVEQAVGSDILFNDEE